MTTKEITGKIVNDTFFGLLCVACGMAALWILPVGSFLRACCICLAMIFGFFFYIATLFRVSGNHHLRPVWKTIWLAVVIIVPVVGGLLYYYLRLLQGHLPLHARLRFKRPVGKHVAAVETIDDTTVAAILSVH